MVEAFALVWALAALGWLAARTGLLAAAAEEALNRFTLHLAMPAALFLRVAEGGLPDGALRGAAVVTATTVLVGVAGYAAARWWLGRRPGQRVVTGMAAGYLNSANLGIPVALHVLGGSAIAVGVIAAQVMVLTPLVLILLDREEAGGRVHWRRAATLPLRHPLVLACGLGAVAAVAGWSVPDLAREGLAALGAAAVPTALVALGMALAARLPEAEVDGRELALVCLLKLVAQPALTYLAAAAVPGMAEAEVRAAVMFAALPTAQLTYVVAARYRTAAPLAARAVTVTTALAMLSLSALDLVW